MTTPSIRALMRRILLSVFIPATIVGAAGFYLLLQERGARDAEERARIMLATALSVRRYTNDHILPELALLPADVFREETVPSFAAQTVFHGVGGSAYRYREVALNPTNPADRSDAFETDLLLRFRADPALQEQTGTVDLAHERVFYVARPIRITDPACLACHSTPAAAPKAMLAKYGPSNGFGWQLNETVALQVLTIPVTLQFASTITLVAVLCAGMVVVFGVAYFALSSALNNGVTRPLRLLADAANEASLQNGTASLPQTGTLELRRLAQTIERLRTSLSKAMAQLSANRDT